MKRALIRLALYPPAFALHLVLPKHCPARPGIAIDRVDGPERFVADDGAPGPYHDRSARAREALAAAWAWWSERLSADVVFLAGATWFVLVEAVIRRGVREGWWPVLWAYLRDVAAGRY